MRSPESAAYRRLYSLAAWRGPHGLRKRTLLRDGYQCRMCGRILSGKKGDDNAPEVDHIQDHKGDLELFLSPDNLQSLCAWPCHTKHRQQQERGTLPPAIGVDGWPKET